MVDSMDRDTPDTVLPATRTDRAVAVLQIVRERRQSHGWTQESDDLAESNLAHAVAYDGKSVSSAAESACEHLANLDVLARRMPAQRSRTLFAKLFPDRPQDAAELRLEAEIRKLRIEALELSREVREDERRAQPKRAAGEPRGAITPAPLLAQLLLENTSLAAAVDLSYGGVGRTDVKKAVEQLQAGQCVTSGKTNWMFVSADFEANERYVKVSLRNRRFAESDLINQVLSVDKLIRSLRNALRQRT